MNLRARWQHLQIHGGRNLRGRSAERLVAVVELLGRLDLRLDAAAVARRAVHFVVAGGKDPCAAGEASVDLPNDADHFSRDVFLGIVVARHVTLHVAVRALHAERFVEQLHREQHVGVRRQHLEVFGRGRLRTGTPACRRWLLRRERD
jgi:hypothetical protein